MPTRSEEERDEAEDDIRADTCSGRFLSCISWSCTYDPASTRAALCPRRPSGRFASFGVKLFEVAVLLAVFNACRPVKDAGDLLILWEPLLEDLGPENMWLICLPSSIGSPYLMRRKSKTRKCALTGSPATSRHWRPSSSTGSCSGSYSRRRLKFLRGSTKFLCAYAQVRPIVARHFNGPTSRTHLTTRRLTRNFLPTSMLVTHSRSIIVVVTGPFINFLLHNHIINKQIIFFFFRRSKRQRNFSLFYFAS